MKEAGGKSAGRRTPPTAAGRKRTHCPVPKGRGQADLRRGKAGASLQHKIKPYIRHMAKPRISDDRALKVADAYPGRPVASRKLTLLKI
ncbi:MAG: hypothetical protein ACYS3N_24510 [Planctomycetota bacterium]